MTRKDKATNSGKLLLKIFCVISTLWAAFVIPGYFGAYANLFAGNLVDAPLFWGILTLIFVTILLALFWSGLIFTYIKYPKLNMKVVAVCAICGMIPIINLFVIFRLIRETDNLQN